MVGHVRLFRRERSRWHAHHPRCGIRKLVWRSYYRLRLIASIKMYELSHHLPSLLLAVSHPFYGGKNRSYTATASKLADCCQFQPSSSGWLGLESKAANWGLYSSSRPIFLVFRYTPLRNGATPRTGFLFHSRWPQEQEQSSNAVRNL